MSERTIPARSEPNVSTVGGAEAPTILPRVDVIEDEEGITVLADLPGVPKEALEVRIEGETLSIEGDIRLDLPSELEPLIVEVRAPRYSRHFRLSRELDPHAIEAKFSDGVVRLRIPKVKQAQARRIEIQTS
ncbi:MAG: Hsp20/alpha crystallin family protein [Hydrogenophilus sp.]|nr:Hsp20/alpha crystallin family protein [Hydrogenophilus sp.]